MSNRFIVVRAEFSPEGCPVSAQGYCAETKSWVSLPNATVFHSDEEYFHTNCDVFKVAPKEPRVFVLGLENAVSQRVSTHCWSSINQQWKWIGLKDFSAAGIVAEIRKP